LHWFDGIDEAAFEETLQVLRRGDFDTVLQAIGNEFNCEGLMFAGMGFIAVSHSKGACRHADDPGVRDRFFDMLFPLVLPENDASQLFLVDDKDEESRCALQLIQWVRLCSCLVILGTRLGIAIIEKMRR
jgi:hypothetical protein